ncbi:MAG TPA: MerR family transcriptional regulator [Gemmatimonadales bacterium]|nr:MerR family transcriptional regulator [Gemmatimonadales bacterium]
MSDEAHVYDLPELSERARVTPRTVRYYIQQGLLPAPGFTGPGAKYGEGHLDRLRLIRRLQQAHLPLAEIRRRLEVLSDPDVRELLAAEADATAERNSGSAADYARGVLSAMAGPQVSASGVPSPPLPPAAERSQWERISLTPDLELHVRRPLSRGHNKLVERILAHARRLLEEEAP